MPISVKLIQACFDSPVSKLKLITEENFLVFVNMTYRRDL